MAYDALDFNDLDDNTSSFEALTENDLVPKEQGEIRELPEYAKGYSKGQTALIGAGHAADRAYGGVKDLILAGQEMIGIDGAGDKRKALQERLNEDHKLYKNGIASDQNPQAGWAKGGQLAGDVAMGYALPFLKGKTIAQTILKNAPIAGGYEVLTTPGTAEERGMAGGLGATGAALGIGGLGVLGKGATFLQPRIGGLVDDLIEGTKRFTGDTSLPAAPIQTKWTDSIAQGKQLLADSFGAPASIGDINGSGLVRAIEQGFSNESHRGPILKKQGDALIDLIGVNKNNLAKGLEETSKEMSKVGNDIFAPVKQKIGRTSILINPTEMHAAAKQLKTDFPSVFEPSFYEKTRLDRFNQWVDDPVANPLKYDEFREIQQMLGKASARAKRMAVNGELDKSAGTMASDAYRRSYNDFEKWGQGSSPATKKRYAEIVKEHANAMKRWQEDVLPFDNDVTASLKNASTPEETAAILLRPSNGSNIKHNILPAVEQHSPQSKHIIDAVNLLNRGARNLSEGVDSGSAHWVDALRPLVAGTQAAVSNATSRPSVKDLYFGEFDQFMNKPMIGAMREQDDLSGSILGMIAKMMQGEDDDKSPGVTTQNSDRGIPTPGNK